MMHENFFKWIDTQNYRCLVCLNGALPEKSFFQQCPIRPLIAVDGSANQLLDKQIPFDLVIGDLDSIQQPILDQVEVIHLPHQSQSDFEKLIDYLNHKNLFPAIILGVGGGHLDHILNNISLFSDLNCIFYAPPILGLMIKPEMPFQMNLPKDTKISLIPLPSAIVSSKGLKWELNQSELSFPGQNSCFNRTKEEYISIAVQSGQILAFLYTCSIDDAGIK
jgi:thiamine pyrophosphokinase